MKKTFLLTVAIFALLVVVALVIIGFTIPHGCISWEHYDSVEQLAFSATNVVRARVLDVRVEWNFSQFEPYSVHRVRVLEVFQGDVEPRDILEVRQPIWHDVARLRFGWRDELVLFLSPGGGLMSPYQAAYHYPPSADGILENVYPFSEWDFQLTIDDLRRLSEGN